MKELKYTSEDLKIMQNWSLQRKIQVTQTRIIEWYQHWEGKVYVSFSGGKDSTVLLDLARRIYPDIEAVFVDTGLEYPEIKEFVRTKENVTWLKPKMNFRQVIKTYGYPVISKEVSKKIYYAKKGSEWAIKMVEGTYTNKDGELSAFNNTDKWRTLLDAPFEISNRCCDVMKKSPLNLYYSVAKKVPIIATMASESSQRKSGWLKTGCNAFDGKHPISKPMSFWTEQDVLRYLKEFNIPYASVYGDIVEEIRYTKKKKMPKPTGKLTTTGVDRTGCMFCMFGVHLEKEPNKFQRMKITHPKIYEYCMKPIEEGGLGLSKVLDYIGVKY